MQQIVIVSATRNNEPDFYTKSALGRSISQSYANFPIKMKVFFNNTRPLPDCYNDAIKDSDFKRKDVTTQAIHNELIKDKRFVLVGRGIYALKEWGYKKGTVADIIADILRDEGKELHRDEIVKRVLESRYVKETTILLNLQGKPQFKRVAKATYALAE